MDKLACCSSQFQNYFVTQNMDRDFRLFLSKGKKVFQDIVLGLGVWFLFLPTQF